MCNQFQILNLINFIIRYRCPKKEHYAKMGTTTQKMSHLSVHSPLWKQNHHSTILFIQPLSIANSKKLKIEHQKPKV
jgi:hypothetical protein